MNKITRKQFEKLQDIWAYGVDPEVDEILDEKMSKMCKMKSIVGFDDYFITDSGEVYSAKSNKFLRKDLRNGYFCVSLYKDKNRTHKYIHRLVAEAFIPNPENFPQVNHKDENKLKNEAVNLEWCTPVYNINYGNSKWIRAKKSGEKQKKKVFAFKDDGEKIIANSISELGEIINSSVNNISSVLHGKQKTAKGYKVMFYNP